MKRLLKALFIALAALGLGQDAHAQNYVQQSGTVTAGHASAWAYSGILQDAGTSTNPVLTTLGVYGTGTPMCVSNTKVRTGGWYNLCLGYASDLSAAQISLAAFGGASTIPLDLVVNGTTYSIGGSNWLSAIFDSQFGSTQGDILYRNGTVWTVLPPGTNGDFLSTGGPGANPGWTAGTSLSPIAANSVLANATASSANPTAVSMSNCTTSSLVVSYTNNSGFSCVPYPTRQVLTSGSAATYTTPTGVRQLRIRIVGGGGGGGGSGTSGTGDGGAGGNTSFNSIVANGGSAGLGNGVGGAGGTGGTGGTSPTTWRTPGSPGQTGGANTAASAFNVPGSVGGSSLLGGGAASGTTNAAANTGGGGGGASPGSVASSQAGGGGGSGEYVELIINSPSASYTYTIGAGGTAGSAGTSGSAGGAGGSGIIIVDEYY